MDNIYIPLVSLIRGEVDHWTAPQRHAEVITARHIGLCRHRDNTVSDEVDWYTVKGTQSIIDQISTYRHCSSYIDGRDVGEE
jgi:hypothetical protein